MLTVARIYFLETRLVAAIRGEHFFCGPMTRREWQRDKLANSSNGVSEFFEDQYSSVRVFDAYFTINKFWTDQAPDGYLILSDKGGQRFLVVDADGNVVGDVFSSGPAALAYAVHHCNDSSPAMRP